MIEATFVSQLSDEFLNLRADLDRGKRDTGFTNFLAQNYPFLYLHMFGSSSAYYQLLLANYPDEKQLARILDELPGSLPAQVLRQYRQLIGAAK